MSTNKEIKMLTREECEKACMYLLKHCYETDAPALENGDKDKTYTFTPSGFEECEIFKRLIEEHFNPKPLKFEEIKKHTKELNLKRLIFTLFANLKKTDFILLRYLQFLRMRKELIKMSTNKEKELKINDGV